MHTSIRSQASTVFESARNTALILLVPVIQLLLLRVFFHSILDVRIGWPAFTDFDLVIPGLIAFFVLRLTLDFIRPQPLVFQPQMAKANTVLMTVLVAWTAIKYPLVDWVGLKFWYVSWFVLAGGMTIASLSLLANPKDYLRRDTAWALLPCALLAFSMVLINNYDALLKPTWRYVGPMVAGSTFHLLQVFWGDAINAYFSTMHLMISHDKSSVLIGTRCGGFDAISFFLILFSLFYLGQRKSFRPGAWIAFIGLGVVLMYFANVVRIASIFSLSIWIADWGMQPAARTWFIYTFHGHVGWIMYLGVAGAYFHGLTQLAARRAAEPMAPVGAKA